MSPAINHPRAQAAVRRLPSRRVCSGTSSAHRPATGTPLLESMGGHALYRQQRHGQTALLAFRGVTLRRRTR